MACPTHHSDSLPLVTIVVPTAVAMAFGLEIRTVGDMGMLSIASYFSRTSPYLETLAIIFPYAVTLTVVGLLESLMTATIVDDLTDTKSDKNRNAKGAGISFPVFLGHGGLRHDRANRHYITQGGGGAYHRLRRGFC